MEFFCFLLLLIFAVIEIWNLVVYWAVSCFLNTPDVARC